MAAQRSGTGPWWREAVIYEVYPLSFSDSDEDGFGDLNGVISKLDYLSDVLGVDALWLCPFFKSPMKDWGYDVSDHRDVDPLFGTIEDARTLIAEAHRRDLKVIVDYVINHTSDEHPWFIESRSSRSNVKRDWYVWRDGRGSEPPNNWVSVFGGPAWSYDETTGQWYRHTFLASQPDVNWRNPQLVEAMLDVVRFWMDLGVDGFRVDAAHQMMKDPLERDNPPAPPDHPRPWRDMGEFDAFIHLHDMSDPAVHDAHRMFQSVVDSYGRDALTVGEVHIFDLPEWAAYYGEKLEQLSMPFNFHLMTAKWSVPAVRAIIESVLRNVPAGAWVNWTLGNHDERRVASRLPTGHDRLAATLLLTLRGTPFLYYGDELGMVEVSATESRDPWGRQVEGFSRDGSRTPMQWTAGPNAGFTSPDTEPWLGLGPNAVTHNVETELADEGSLLNTYRRLLQLRKGSKALRLGSFLSDPASTEEVFVYRRESDDETKTVVLNFSDEPKTVSISPGQIVFHTHDPTRRGATDGEVTAVAHAGVIVSHR
jgi:alpha-glucosidase